MKNLLAIFLFASFAFSFFSCVTDSNLFPEHSIDLKKNDSITAAIKFKESLKINEEFSISFIGVNADSRCPVDVICVWAGDAEIVLQITKQNFDKNFILHSYLFPRSVVLDNYEIELINVFPKRKSNVKLEQTDYSIEVKIVYRTNQERIKAHLIDSNLDWTISKDYLKINSASIEKNWLNLSVCYSGGCK